MNDTETIADVIGTAVKAATTPLLMDIRMLQNQVGVWEVRWSDLATLRERVAVVEARAPIPGPPGPQGEPGKDGARGGDGYTGAVGPPGKDGQSAELPADLLERIAALETGLVPVPELSAEEITRSLAETVRAELSAFEVATPTQRQRRVLRDEQGRIDRVIDEPVA